MNKNLLLIIILFAANVNSTEIENVLACENETNSQIEVVKKVQPRYPTSPYAGGYIEGWVKLEVRVDHNGKAIEIQIINADPSRRFERSAKKALEQWEFSKSTKQEIRCGIIAMEFKLEN
ncbi:MAG: TonB family protein [Kangiellaceae bacterium]|jgi:periplasmic protein TonB